MWYLSCWGVVKTILNCYQPTLSKLDLLNRTGFDKCPNLDTHFAFLWLDVRTELVHFQLPGVGRLDLLKHGARLNCLWEAIQWPLSGQSWFPERLDVAQNFQYVFPYKNLKYFRKKHSETGTKILILKGLKFNINLLCVWPPYNMQQKFNPSPPWFTRNVQYEGPPLPTQFCWAFFQAKPVGKGCWNTSCSDFNTTIPTPIEDGKLMF